LSQTSDQQAATAAGKPQIQLPGYQIEKLLGRGGMAAVYLAIQESFGREVAIKVLEPAQAEAENFSERFLREAKIVSRLSHPHIVTVYDAGIRDGYHYYSMEYIEGPNLKQALPSLSLGDRLRIIKDVARALEYAGNKGYVHRDVKPENIMIRQSDGHVVLTDFGIARGDEVTHGMTQTGRAIGTPHYMSPEQTKGVQVDPRSDIYSLGVVLYLMLSGHVPYDADSAIAVGIKHLSAPIPQLPPDMKIFQSIINNCLSKNPEHRYQTAGELIAALDAIPPQAIQAIEARSPNPVQGHDINAATMADADLDYSVASELLNETRSATTTTGTPTTVTTGHQRVPRRKRRTGGLFVFLLVVLLGGSVIGIWHGRQEIVRLWKHLDLPGAKQLVASVTGETPQSGNPVSANSPVTTADEPTQIVDPVQYLYSQLEADPANAIVLAQTYRARLGSEPPDTQAIRNLKLMQEWFHEQMQTAFETRNVVRARELVDSMQQAFPRFAASPRFSELQQRLEKAEQIQTYLDRGDHYLEQKALIAPPDANALAAYRAALELAPNQPDAQQGIRRIVDNFHNQAIQHQSRGEFQLALDNVKTALEIDADDSDLTAMRQQLQQQIKTQQQVSALIKHGDEAFNRGNLLSPRNDNALYYYQKALKLEPENTPAKDGMLKIQQQKLLKVQFEIRKKRFQQAEAMLSDLEKRFGKTESINHSWETLFSAIDNSLPKITRLIYSDLEVKSLNLSQPSTVKPIRNLYFGFAYENFPASENQVEAYLMDASGQVAMAHKTLTLKRQEGEYFANLLLPINEMQDGRYRLLLLMDDKPLQQSTLYLDIQ
jgi:serine/threonine protein kinase/tetratricopeptide (TPR) repeat protein